jgi:hypothetical protein
MGATSGIVLVALLEGVMNETDDRLAGDIVWELFAHAAPEPTQQAIRTRQFRRWLVVASVIAVAWLLSPTLAVVTACPSVAGP